MIARLLLLIARLLLLVVALLALKLAALALLARHGGSACDGQAPGGVARLLNCPQAQP